MNLILYSFVTNYLRRTQRILSDDEH